DAGLQQFHRRHLPRADQAAQFDRGKRYQGFVQCHAATPHSTLMLARCAISRIETSSVRIKASLATASEYSGSNPSASRFLRTSGSATVSRSAASSRALTWAGKPRGATIISQVSMFTLGYPACAMVGTSGKKADGLGAEM